MGRATNSAVQANANKPESYSGEIMLRSMLKPSDFEHACAVIVTGDEVNFCGHTLLHTKHDWYSMWLDATPIRSSCMKTGTSGT